MKPLVGAWVLLCGAVASAAVRVDTDFPAGIKGTVEYVAADHVRFKPQTKAPGGQFFHTCVRVAGLDAGQTLQLDLLWPPAQALEPAAGPAPTGDAARPYFPSFAGVLPKIVVQSSDLRTWRPVEGVTLVDANTIRVPVHGTGGILYVSTQIPYHSDLLEDLCAFVQAREPGACVQIGTTHSGFPLRVITLEATRPEARKRTVFIVAYQHGTEYSGALVADALIRHLVGTAEGRRAREALSFQILPVFDVDGLDRVHPRKPRTGQASNPNRDWEDKTWPEVRHVDAFIRANLQAGRTYALGLDLHNGWTDLKSSGGCYILLPDASIDAAKAARQKQFCAFMFARTDHEAPGTCWAHDPKGKFIQYFTDVAHADAYTLEFSRFEWWNRATAAYEPYRPEHIERFARQCAAALAEYCGAPATAAR